jgi:hypothetical protein
LPPISGGTGEATPHLLIASVIFAGMILVLIPIDLKLLRKRVLGEG